MNNPRNYIVTDTLKDGTTVTIRAIRRNDSGKVLEAFTNLDRESIYTRFFTYKRHLTETELRQLTDVDFDHVVALVVTTRTRMARPSLPKDATLPTMRRVHAAVPKWPSRLRRSTKGAASHAYSCGTSFESPARTACRGLRPMCSQETSRCSPSFAAAACRCNSAAKTVCSM